MTEELVTLIKKNRIIIRYNQYYKTDILEKINYYNDISNFSLGILFLLLQNKKSFDKNDIEMAEAIQLLFLSANLIDDFYDQDNDEIKFIENNNLVLLSTELLLYSISKLHVQEEFKDSFFYLQEAFEGEFYDINTNIITDTNVLELYHEKILNKSSCLFKFVFRLISTKEEFQIVWENFCQKYTLFLQIANDIYGILGDSSDIKLKRPTLPLILYLNDNNSSLLSSKEIKKSGVIEYCIFIRENLKRDCKKILKENKVDEKIINYLNLGEDILVK